jgi:hypothetical protein
MFGLELSRSEWAALGAIAFLFVRVLCAVGLVLWWYVTDAIRVSSPRFNLTMLTSIAVAVMCVSLLSITTDWPFRGFRIVVYIATAVVGLMLGFMFDLVVSIRLWKVSNWLTSLRVPQYRERLLHGDAEVRLGAAARLGQLGLYSRPARPELLAVVRGDESADVRTAAALAVLYSIPDPPDEDADLARELKPSLSDPDARVRTVAAAVQVTFRSTPPAELLPVLREGLKTEAAEVAGIAADALGRIGPDAAPAIPDLRDSAMGEANGNLSAPEALSKIGEAAIPALVEILERGESTCRWAAADVLGRMGPAARAALPALRKAAAEDDGMLGSAAKRSIKLLGGEIS